MQLVVVVGVALSVMTACEGVTFSRCELTRVNEHMGPGVKWPQLSMNIRNTRGVAFAKLSSRTLTDGVCLVENESSRTTSKIGKVNKNGSRDYGLFQINDKYWCSNTNTPGKDCHVTCSELLTDDIKKAATCAKKVYQRHGFNAWYGWKNHCQGSLPDISSC